ncbi:hypoxanthine-guanine phosphoribosyltransferase [Wenzhouxiangella sp. XN79A]|uniref:phosphoribosyltransferase family protein n=1 Tax=Wenzhouxiangella sp. XN79A TaxID=2724193 RepID=UPI00144AA024|nr:phosphoribosyltransferase family protein [Wenzhouxiangella sp. XN79A]NKI34415.1 hypoxanthine-guanine phosphoribosyltransferase [Wenzhouxiangella sp. XN79A]
MSETTMTETTMPEGAERLFDAAQVAAAYDRLAVRLDAALPEGPVLLLTVMTGGLFPAVEVARRLKRPITIDYVHATRYRGATRGGEIDWIRWPALPDSSRQVLLVDDIFDEGHTLAAVRDRIASHHDVTTAVLALKRHDRGLPRDWIDHYGLEVPDRYVFGCGMDHAERWRELPEIWALPDAH